MELKQNITTSPGNTPVRNIPDDYYPPGCGFWYTLPEGVDAGKKLFYRFSTHGKGEAQNTIVFVHGNPECSYIYRNIIKEIVTAAKKPINILAMDHIGMGLSDQATFQMECMNHADNLRQLIRHLNVKNATLVIHDWGGPIGVGAFLKEPDRVSNLVVTNTTVFPMPPKGLTYKNYPIIGISWSRYPFIIPRHFWGSFASYAIYRTPANPLMIIIQLLVYLAMAEIGIFIGDEKIAKRLFKEQFKSKSNILSSKRFVRQTRVWGHGNTFKEPRLGLQDTTPFYRFIQENIKSAWGPKGRNIGVRAVLGQWDPLGKEEVIEQWTSNLPQLKGHVKVLENVSHFIDEVKPGEVAKAVLDVARLI